MIRCNCSHSAYSTSALLSLTIIVGFLTITGSVAVAGEWHRYENKYFIGFSDANEDRARELLDDLEAFRAAFSQIANVEIPSDAPKTEVLIVRKKGDFKKLTSNRNVAGFMLKRNDAALIVLPAAGDLDWGKTVIRHEYGHALLHYKPLSYPSWYAEGFSELCTTIELSDDRQSFSVGEIPDRAVAHRRPSYDWDDLVSDDFNPHKITGLRDGSSAYAQAWMLVHYTTLGDDFKNAPRLQKYFDALTRGQPSAEAFKDVFGMTASELWSSKLKDYMRRVPYYTFRFEPDAMDRDFNRVVAAEADYQTKINFLRQQTIAKKSNKSPSKPLPLLAGQWDYLSMEGDCDDSFELLINETKQEITIEHFLRDNDGPWEPWTFKYEVGRKGLFTLTSVDRPDNDNKYSTVYLQMRSKDLACAGLSNTEVGLCAKVLKRCSL
jgi:hypothetical protein